jgi:hypothetical protein
MHSHGFPRSELCLRISYRGNTFLHLAASSKTCTPLHELSLSGISGLSPEELAQAAGFTRKSAIGILGDFRRRGLGHLGTHAFRHTYRSWLDAVGTPIAVQQKRRS